MGLFDLFNKQKRELILVRIENDRCINERRKLLNSFRDNAKWFLKFKYPNSVILINNHCTLFVLYDKLTSHIHQGEFADYYAPFLEYVPDDSNLLEIYSAIRSFKEQWSRWQSGALIREHRHSRLYKQRWKSDFHKNGFYIKDTYRYDIPIKKGDFFGFSLFLNERKIAFSSCWDPKPAGYFAESIFKHVISARHTSRTGFSMLSLVAGCIVLASEKVVGCAVPGRIQYEIIFGNGDRLSDPNYTSDAKQSIVALRDLLSELENEIDGDYQYQDKSECHAILNNHERKDNHPGIEDMYPQ